MNKPSQQWKQIEGKLVRIIVFGNFKETIDAVNKISEIAEKMNHHPDLEIFSYKNLKIKISTHDVKKLTERDYNLAEAIDILLGD